MPERRTKRTTNRIKPLIGPDVWKRGPYAGKRKVIIFPMPTCDGHRRVGDLGRYKYPGGGLECVRCRLEQRTFITKNMSPTEFDAEVSRIQTHMAGEVREALLKQERDRAVDDIMVEALKTGNDNLLVYAEIILSEPLP